MNETSSNCDWNSNIRYEFESWFNSHVKSLEKVIETFPEKQFFKKNWLANQMLRTDNLKENLGDLIQDLLSKEAIYIWMNSLSINRETTLDGLEKDANQNAPI
jgi:hypothetical protein